MTEAITAPDENRPSRRGLLLSLALAGVLAAAGFGTVYFGIWSPRDMLSAPADTTATPALPPVVFVEVPVIEVPVPGGRDRNLVLAVSIETDEAGRGTITHLLPRVSDSFTTFLTGIDPAAYDKRGVLEVIRTELVSRARMVLGEEPVKDILITEFRFK